jgi:nucleotide-binding universal stress UspA family protein
MAAGRIAVGIDGSVSSRHALRWALDEARLRGVGVDAIHVWRYPVWTCSPAIVTPPVFARDDLEAEAHAVLDAAVKEILGDDDEPPVVRRVVLEGSAAERLLEQAESAALLVVGHRGRGGFAGLLLASVAHQCSAHSACPVVVVR